MYFHILTCVLRYKTCLNVNFHTSDFPFQSSSLPIPNLHIGIVINIFIEPILICGIFVLHFTWHGKMNLKEPGKLLDFKAAWLHPSLSCSSPPLQSLLRLPEYCSWSVLKDEKVKYKIVPEQTLICAHSFPLFYLWFVNITN